MLLAKKTNKFVLRFVLCAIVMLCLIGGWTNLWSGTASAQTEALQITIQSGLDGKVKPNKWYPVHFTITNPGEDLSGELAVQISGSDKDTIYSAKVDLPSQETKVVTINLPGENLNSRNNSVTFYRDSIESGRKVDIAGEPISIQTDAVSPQTYQVGVIARDADTMNFLSLLNQRGYQIRSFPLSLDQVPGEALMLDGVDALVLNDINADQFSPEQIEAIHSWVKGGGKLILAGGAGYPKTAEPFEELSPVSYQQTRSVTGLSALTEAGQRELVISEPFTLSAASIKDGSVLFMEEGIPLFVTAKRGNGEVMYAAYDLSLNPLASWNGNPNLWESLLYDGLQQSLSGNQGSRGWSWEINDALEYFPSLTPPSIGILVLVLVVYAIIIGPLLYFLLKKLDRREWGWVAIPLLAILCSIGIYGVGASGRGAVMTQSLHTIELDGKGQGIKNSASAVFVPQGGSFLVELPGSYYAAPISNNYGNTTDLRGSADLVIEKKPEATDLRFQGVSYWSVRKLRFESGRQEPFGQLDYTLDTATMSGEITNRLQHALDDVHIYFNGQVAALGSVNRGDTVDYQLASQSTSGFNMGRDIAQLIFPYQGDRDDNRQKRALLMEYMVDPSLGFDPSGIYIIGFTQANSPSLYKVDGKSIQSNEVNMWVQKLQYDYVNGSQVHVPRGAVVPVPDFGETQINYQEGNAYDLGPGEVILSYRLPDIQGVKYSTLSSFQTYTDASVHYELWDEVKQEWTAISSGQSIEGELPSYLTDSQLLKIKMTLQNNNYVRFPDFAIEGTVNP